ncbi:MAG: LacI family DNA-binding transcriptional regulator [Lachnospiraceae bacterium]|nr:LacI family DNA-binding transcriptional regulator [Lachnospiraceae bacterium]
MASIKDVAQRAQVGAATVSRVLNGNGYVSEATRKKIEAAMKELDYTPNELARNLYRKRAGIIAVIVPDAAHPFFAEFVKKVEFLLHEKGYKMMLCNTVESRNNEKEYLDMLNRHIVDGIISGCHTLEIEEYSRIQKPIVALDRELGEYIPMVASDHKKGGELAAECLIKKGCKCVVQFVGSFALESPYQERHRVFEQIMKKNGIQVYDYEMGWNKFDHPYYQMVARQIFDLHPEADGIFGADMIALGYLKECLARGKRVPEDVKIVAYDGTYLTNLVTPSVTAIEQNIDELAGQSVRLILKLIEGHKYRNKVVTVDVVLNEKEST